MLLRQRRLYSDPEAPTQSALSELTVRFGSNDSGTPNPGAFVALQAEAYFASPSRSALSKLGVVHHERRNRDVLQGLLVRVN